MQVGVELGREWSEISRLENAQLASVYADVSRLRKGELYFSESMRIGKFYPH